MRGKSVCAVILAVLTAYVFTIPAQAAPKPRWTEAAPMGLSRVEHQAVPLPDGRVLVISGNHDTCCDASTELYDPATDTWSFGASMLSANGRQRFEATLLADGRVLVTGGVPDATPELYDPSSDMWSVAAQGWCTPFCLERFIDHTATLLGDGRVLVAGGTEMGPRSFLFDPTSETWTPGPDMSTSRQRHTATLLPDGRVLVAGGVNGLGFVGAELYDPQANAWSPASPMNTPREFASATLLPDGRVLVAGGVAQTSFLSSAEAYDPTTDDWTPVGSMAIPHVFHTATLLPTGRVAVVAGYQDGNAFSRIVELFDPSTGSWTRAAPLPIKLNRHQASLLQNGKLLVTGGEASRKGIQSPSPSRRTFLYG